MTHKTYRAIVTLQWDDLMGDRATVAVNGLRWRTDYHWSDGLATLARRATVALFDVDHVVSVERDTHTMLPAGAVAVFTVSAAL